MSGSVDSVVNRPKMAFEPSMKILLRITKVLFERNSIGRTELAQMANLQYGRLTKYMEWLERRSFVEFSLENRRVLVRLTVLGREFLQKISKPNFEAF